MADTSFIQGTMKMYKGGAFSERPGETYVYVNDIVTFLNELELGLRRNPEYDDPKYIAMVDAIRKSVKQWDF